MTKKALEGVRVLDLTNVLSGPYATLHLALLGAEVIKIENPVGGDLARKLGNVPKLNQELMGTSFLAQNANKRSITLNLKKKEAKDVFLKLVAGADVVVENFRPGALEGWGEPGPGKWITVYANAGHAFMVVAGWRFDTVALASGGTRWSQTMADTSGFVVRHPPGL